MERSHRVSTEGLSETRKVDPPATVELKVYEFRFE